MTAITDSSFSTSGQFVPAVCLNCARELRLPQNRDRLLCIYCGADIEVRKAIAAFEEIEARAAKAKVARSLELGRIAQFVGNDGEAIRDFSEVLELDPLNSDALIGKGISTAISSGRDDFNCDELINYARLAVENCPRDSRDAFRSYAAECILTKCVDARVSFSGDVSPEVMRNIASALEFALELSPGNVDIIEAAYLQNAYLHHESGGQMTGKVAEYLARIRSIDPERADDLEALTKGLSPVSEKQPVKALPSKHGSSRYWVNHARDIERHWRLERRRRLFRSLTGAIFLLVAVAAAIFFFSSVRPGGGWIESNDVLDEGSRR